MAGTSQQIGAKAVVFLAFAWLPPALLMWQQMPELWALMLVSEVLLSENSASSCG